MMAPALAALAASAAGAGAIATAAIAAGTSFLATKVTGGSWGDAFKSGAIAGIGSGIGSVASSAWSGAFSDVGTAASEFTQAADFGASGDFPFGSVDYGQAIANITDAFGQATTQNPIVLTQDQFTSSFSPDLLGQLSQDAFGPNAWVQIGDPGGFVPGGEGMVFQEGNASLVKMSDYVASLKNGLDAPIGGKLPDFVGEAQANYNAFSEGLSTTQPSFFDEVLGKAGNAITDSGMSLASIGGSAIKAIGKSFVDSLNAPTGQSQVSAAQQLIVPFNPGSNLISTSLGGPTDQVFAGSGSGSSKSSGDVSFDLASVKGDKNSELNFQNPVAARQAGDALNKIAGNDDGQNDFFRQIFAQSVYTSSKNKDKMDPSPLADYNFADIAFNRMVA